MNKQEFLPNGSLDHWLREHADGTDPLPAADGWDLPSEQVWAAVQAGRQRRRRRRLVFFWWLLLGAVLGGGALVWRFEMPAGHRDSGEIADVPNQLPEISGRVDPTPSVNPDPSPKGRRDLTRVVVAPLPFGEGSGVGLTEGEEPMSSITSISNKPATTPSTVTTPKDELPKEIPFQRTAPETTTPSFHTTASNLAPLVPRPLPILAQSPKLPTGSAPLPLQLPLKTDSGAWAFGASGGYFFTTRTLRAGASDRPNGSEHGAWTWQGGLLARRALNRHWSLESGLQWTSIRLQAERSGSLRFRTNQERYDPAREVYQTTARQQLQTSFGAVQMRFDISRRAGQAIDDQEIIRLRLSTDEQVHYLRLPLALRYSDGRNRWRWGAQIGGGLSLRTGYELDLKAGSSDRIAIVGVQARAERRAAGLAKFVGDTHLALDVDYQITPRFALHLAPEFRQGFSSLYRNGPFNSYPVSAGLQTGFTLKFN